jgi:hypothetical protein
MGQQMQSPLRRLAEAWSSNSGTLSSKWLHIAIDYDAIGLPRDARPIHRRVLGYCSPTDFRGHAR